MTDLEKVMQSDLPQSIKDMVQQQIRVEEAFNYKPETLQHIVRWCIANVPDDAELDFNGGRWLPCDLCRLAWWNWYGWDCVDEANPMADLVGQHRIDPAKLSQLIRTAPDPAEAMRAVRVLTSYERWHGPYLDQLTASNALDLLPLESDDKVEKYMLTQALKATAIGMEGISNCHAGKNT